MLPTLKWIHKMMSPCHSPTEPRHSSTAMMKETSVIFLTVIRFHIPIVVSEHYMDMVF